MKRWKTSNPTFRAVTLLFAYLVTVAAPSPAEKAPKKATATPKNPSSAFKPLTSSSLLGDKTLAFAKGEAGRLSVVMIGPPENRGQSRMDVVRNNTSKPLYRVEVTGVARAGTKLVGTGGSHGFKPLVVLPGEIAVGYVYWQAPLVSSELKIELTTTSVAAKSQAQGLGGMMSIALIEAAVRDDPTSSRQIIGILKNTNASKVEGPISVVFACFNLDGAPLQTVSTFANEDGLEPGALGTFAAQLFDDATCPRFLGGASGFSQ